MGCSRFRFEVALVALINVGDVYIHLSLRVINFGGYLHRCRYDYTTQVPWAFQLFRSEGRCIMRPWYQLGVGLGGFVDPFISTHHDVRALLQWG